MLRPRREQELLKELVDKYYLHLKHVRAMAVEEESDRIAQGYDEFPYWHKYSFPMGALAQAEHKLIRLRTVCTQLPAEELLEDKNFAALLDNAIGLANYASFFGASLMLFKEEADGPPDAPYQELSRSGKLRGSY